MTGMRLGYLIAPMLSWMISTIRSVSLSGFLRPDDAGTSFHLAFGASLYPGYVVLYQIFEGDLEIARVIHGSRDLGGLLSDESSSQ